MSETIAPPATPTATEPEATPTPDVGAVSPSPTSETPAAQPAPTPTPEPFATFPDADSLNKRLQREARKRMNASAKELGYDDWEHMQSELAAQRQAASPAPADGDGGDTPAEDPPTQQPPTPTGQDEAARLRMALQVGTEKNLPPALIARLQGATAEEMAADADSLMAVMATGQPRTPGIPGVPRNEQTATFTRAQLQDPAFVREHAADIQRASREGRIVDA
ncbi:MAG: hypothetical protein WBO46_15000 [Caldilineaceae bacterium]